MSSQQSPAIPSLGNTFGALFVGATIAAILFGITNLQTLIYYKRYPNDWSLYRYSVTLLWVLDAVHLTLSTHALYFYLIDMYGNLLGALIGNVIWSMRFELPVAISPKGVDCHAIRYLTVETCISSQWSSLVMAKLSIFLVGQHFHKILPWFVLLAVSASVGNSSFSLHLFSLIMPPFPLGAGIFGSYDIYRPPNLVSISTINMSIYTFYSIIITADIIIAVMMCYYLHKSRAAMHFSSMADLLLILMQLVLVSGVATR
ncbi:uncharacterized protein EV420DRAFT_1652217 [Desarmillaria tabescens]|uniref:Uncharacterized protein n=1 Tax=Armillaria tabescens TaxID=1929756 RepID=A0AA39MKJ3_ARMTA|nr:uncharacterized protein EV420DRAFT_1652217 [Desarmillaria tabescens]KAK0437089.1 hypothetical protein EV420DRAFT_1652217 [Desarmillaria tabescens]